MDALEFAENLFGKCIILGKSAKQKMIKTQNSKFNKLTNIGNQHHFLLVPRTITYQQRITKYQYIELGSIKYLINYHVPRRSTYYLDIRK